MRYIQGTNRDQGTLLPELLDDYVAENNPVRFLDAFVDTLDMTCMNFTYAETKETGRKPFNPADMLKLYLFGYLNKIRSSRQLEKATHSNIELMWLLRRLQPDFKTIANFRKNNSQAIKNVCREFTLKCKELNLFGMELIAIDGSKFKAYNSNKRNYTRNKLIRLIKKIDEEIDTYLREVDNGDENENAVVAPSGKDLKKKIEILKKRKDKYKKLQSRLDQSQESQISLTDPDSRMMKSNQGKDVCYNVQIATDSKHKLIVTHQVSNQCTDSNQLHHMAVMAKQQLEAERIKVVADAGYYERVNIKNCQRDNIELFVPQPTRSHNKKLNLYTNKDFKYNSEHDHYRCPAGELLTFRGLRKRTKSGLIEKKYTTHSCYACPQKNKCTRSKRTRYIYRWEHEDVIEKLEQRMEENKEIIKERKSLVEHPFGTIKNCMGHHHFYTRGIDRVSTEMDLTVLAYNIRRVLNIVNFKELMAFVS